MSRRHSQTERFVAFTLCAPDRDSAERAAAEAFDAGASGWVEQDEGPEGLTFTVYAPAARSEAVRAALEAEALPVSPAVPVPDVDWSERWKRDLVPIVVSPRLVLRPSFDATPETPGQHVLRIDPAQAFGTGAHESTRLALDCLDALAEEISLDTRVLDVGAGTGVLALTALRFGCRRAVAFDLDPLAGEAARTNARANGLADGLELFVGTTDALAPDARFDLVLANLLLSEIAPLIEVLARHTAPQGAWIVSGLLASQQAGFEAAVEPLGLSTSHTRRRVDASGSCWVGLVMRRPSARASGGTAARA